MIPRRSILGPRVWILLVGGAILAACAKSSPDRGATFQARDGRLDVAGLHWSTPKNWKQLDPSPRIWAMYRRAAVEGDGEGAELTVRWFGPKSAGDIEKTLRLWVSEMNAPDGGDANRVALRSRRVGSDAIYDFVVVDGIYQRSMGGGPMTGGRTKALPGYHMVGVVVEGPEGQAFFHLVGPEATSKRMEAEMRAMFRTSQSPSSSP